MLMLQVLKQTYKHPIPIVQLQKLQDVDNQELKLCVCTIYYIH